MKYLLVWWHNFSLPKHEPDTTPIERERTRYARLTSTFTLLILVARIILVPLIFFVLNNPTVRTIETLSFFLILLAIGASKQGFNIVAASIIVLSTIISVVGAMFSTPLDPSFLPVFGVLVVPVLLAGSLMPPVAAIFTGLLNSVLILFITSWFSHTAAYDAMTKHSAYTVTLGILVITQLVVAVVTYVILNNLLSTIQRADRAEEIVALQKELAQHARQRAQEQRRLEEGLDLITQVHTAVANGNLDVRVPLGADSILWQVGVPLNNLLSRVRHWKRNSDQLEKTQAVVDSMLKNLQKARAQNRPVLFQHQTGTPLDPLLPEVNHLSEQAFKATRFRE